MCATNRSSTLGAALSGSGYSQVHKVSGKKATGDPVSTLDLYKEKRLDLERAKQLKEELEDDVSNLERKLNRRTKRLSEVSGRTDPTRFWQVGHVRAINLDPRKKETKIELKKCMEGTVPASQGQGGRREERHHWLRLVMR